MTFSCWLHWRLRLYRRVERGVTGSCWLHYWLRLLGGEVGWQVDTDFNVGYGFVGGEGAGWRVHAGFITRCRCVRRGRGRGGRLILASL